MTADFLQDMLLKFREDGRRVTLRQVKVYNLCTQRLGLHQGYAFCNITQAIKDDGLEVIEGKGVQLSHDFIQNELCMSIQKFNWYCDRWKRAGWLKISRGVGELEEGDFYAMDMNALKEWFHGLTGRRERNKKSTKGKS